ncbi:YjjG family noncanonical pyrimidine nucleotidase [Pseudofulvibacter geojedonensis]|uniref:YjjG family noncanonical pyrimidine nucleotidase n=1 Tax=Pseudofulvibacter geojedonensis TaxID=1123758 RepID=A0ABW3I4V6_9FLAO
MKKITDIFFDLDHTLWDFDKNSEISYGIIFSKLSLDVDIITFLSAYKQINIHLWKLFREEKIDKETLRYKRLRDTFNVINYNITDEVIYKIADEYIYYLSKQTHLLEGAEQLLEYLKPKYKLHIITNGFQEVQVGKLNNTDLIRYFDVVVNSEMAGVKKPNPKIFEMALELANVKKENAIMIGDSYEADILGALDIGLDAICYNYHQEILPTTIKQVNHLNELQEIF